VTGFIKGLFSKRQPNDEAAASKPEKVKPEKVKPVPQRVQKNSDAYFLDADSASSMGNIDYMRTVKNIKRTYAKGINGAVPDLNTQVSSMTAKKQQKMDAAQSSFGAAQSNTTAATPTPAQVRERRRADSSMDMFRNMAKDIGKS
jgi:Na+-transporting NADH:ubiquinone oxidoreductase subunit NqrC